MDQDRRASKGGHGCCCESLYKATPQTTAAKVCRYETRCCSLHKGCLQDPTTLRATTSGQIPVLEAHCVPPLIGNADGEGEEILLRLWARLLWEVEAAGGTE